MAKVSNNTLRGYSINPSYFLKIF